MHELSIATKVVEIALEHARNAGAANVSSITLRIGELACVHKAALEFGFEVVAEGTQAEGAELRIIEVPVSVFCVPCDQEVELPGIQRLCCPRCGSPSADIRHGQELEVEMIEIVEDADVSSGR